MERWRTAIANSDPDSIRIRGYDIGALMKETTFTDVVFVLHHARLPTPAERRLLDAILIGVSDHGPGAPSCAAARLVASGNRQSVSAAVAAGVLAIGDAHAGAGSACMELIAAGVAEARGNGRTIADAAERAVEAALSAKRRIPGLGHRVHTEKDPRVDVLFGMAREAGLARDGVEFVLGLEAAARTRIRPLPINVDGALAAVLHDLGFTPEAGQFFFIIGRVAGLTAEVAEEYAREKPMRVRIAVDYDGVPPRPVK